MQGYRSKLKPFKRRIADKTGAVKTYWTARGFVPQRRADGSFARRRVEISIGGDTAAARQAAVDRLNEKYEERALNVPLTFARAYTNYIESGHPVPLFGEQLVLILGLRQCHEIDDSAMIDARGAMFKPTAKPSYVNRHLYTPVVAILRMALRQHAPLLTRPVGHKDVAPLAIPDLDWFRAIAPYMSPVTVALVWFLTVHGRRLGDALGRVPADFNPDAGTLQIGRAKDGSPLHIELHAAVVKAFKLMPDWEKQRWLFRDGPRSGNNVRRDILVACLKANGLEPKLADTPKAARIALQGQAVPYFGTHAIGRHSAATRALLEGYSLLHVARMFGWASIEMVAKRYGHLAKNETTAAVHSVGGAFFKAISSSGGDKLGNASPAHNAKLGGLLKKRQLNRLPAQA